jgi:delta 1-pyrroline-5-carboxylate dehydrogenase
LSADPDPLEGEIRRIDEDLARCCAPTLPNAVAVAGMAYLVRRLPENTSNESFLHEQSRGVPLETLLAVP